MIGTAATDSLAIKRRLGTSRFQCKSFQDNLMYLQQIEVIRF